MWLPSAVIYEVDRIAVISYIGRDDTRAWNEHRRPDELRLLTGWAWSSRRGEISRQGFKTQTVAYRDAYYTLIREQEAPYALMPKRRRAA